MSEERKTVDTAKDTVVPPKTQPETQAMSQNPKGSDPTGKVEMSEFFREFKENDLECSYEALVADGFKSLGEFVQSRKEDIVEFIDEYSKKPPMIPRAERGRLLNYLKKKKSEMEGGGQQGGLSAATSSSRHPFGPGPAQYLGIRQRDPSEGTDGAKRRRTRYEGEKEKFTLREEKLEAKTEERKFSFETFLESNASANNSDVATKIVRGHMIDKTEIYYDFLNKYCDRDPVTRKYLGDFCSVPIAIIQPRRMGKSSFLQTIQAILTPCQRMGNKRVTRGDVEQAMLKLKRGKELLEFGTHPVVLLTVDDGWRREGDFISEISSSLEVAGLSEETIDEIDPYKHDPRRKLSPSTFLKCGIIKLNKKFRNDTGTVSKTVILIDEYDKLHRKIKQKEELEGFVKQIMNLCKNFDGISLFIVAGLTRMVGAGLTEFNHINKESDVTLWSENHGLCGITIDEIVEHLGLPNSKLFERNENLKEFLRTEIVPHFNGFSSAVYNRNQKDNNLEKHLIAPVDVAEVLIPNWEHLNPKGSDLAQVYTNSKWIKTMSAEFEFTVLETKNENRAPSVQRCIRDLCGGQISVDDLTKKIDRKSYQSIENTDFRRRLYFELGLLAVDRVEGSGGQATAFLVPTNLEVSEKAAHLLYKKFRFQNPIMDYDKACELMKQEWFDEITQKAASVLTKLYERCSWLPREYALQNEIYLQLCSEIGPQVDGLDGCKLLLCEYADNRNALEISNSGRTKRLDIFISFKPSFGDTKAKEKRVLVEVKCKKGTQKSGVKLEDIGRTLNEQLAIAQSQMMATRTYQEALKSDKTKLMLVAIVGVWDVNRKLHVATKCTNVEQIQHSGSRQ